MCCESCIRYEKCLEDDQIKDECCPRCPEYNECSSAGKGESSGGDNYDGYDKEDENYY
ncbi:MAG: hypothetical protein PHV77_01895 [Candidatus Omnitrophica bacterium]|nr:hypothetical protein [Candidatus Omnitrophota bacterium]